MTPPDWPDEVEDGYGDAADGDAADGDAADDEEEVMPTKKRKKKKMRETKPKHPQRGYQQYRTRGLKGGISIPASRTINKR